MPTVPFTTFYVNIVLYPPLFNHEPWPKVKVKSKISLSFSLSSSLSLSLALLFFFPKGDDYGGDGIPGTWRHPLLRCGQWAQGVRVWSQSPLLFAACHKIREKRKPEAFCGGQKPVTDDLPLLTLQLSRVLTVY